MDAAYPDAVLIAEWGHPDQAIPAGFHMDFLLGFDNPGVVSSSASGGLGPGVTPTAAIL